MPAPPTELVQAAERVEEFKERQKNLKAELATVKRELTAARKWYASCKNRIRRQNKSGIVIQYTQAAPVPLSDEEEEEEEEEDAEEEDEEEAEEDPDAPIPPPAPAPGAGGEDDLLADFDNEGQ
eukprot:g20639.t1